MTRLALLPLLALAGCCAMNIRANYTSGSSTVNGVRLEHTRTLTATCEQPMRVLRLDLDSADISVLVSEGDTVAHAEMEVHEKEPGDVELTFTKTGPVLKSRGGHPFLAAKATLHVPPALSADLRTGTGDVLVRGLHGGDTLKISTATGDIRVQDLGPTADVGLETSTGRIDLEGSGPLGKASFQTATGDITARRCNLGHLTAHTSTGDIDCRTSTTRTRSLHTGTGEILQDVAH